MLNFPSNFDPAKKYPLLVSVYAGPATNGARETFALPSPLTEYGFLVASLRLRGARAGRARRPWTRSTCKLGIVEIDDQAAGVKSLWDRPYVDKERVGIFGTSYGGYASAMCLLRYPDVFPAACAQSAVTSWHHYDTIYTERYMWIPQENKEGYDAGSAMTYADEPQGPADDLLRHGGQQRPPDQRHAAHPGPAEGGQELRGAGRARPGPLRPQPGADDGVLHREPGAEVLTGELKSGRAPARQRHFPAGALSGRSRLFFFGRVSPCAHHLNAGSLSI